MTEEEFMSKFAAHVKDSAEKERMKDRDRMKLKRDMKNTSSEFKRSSHRLNPIHANGSVDKIVLKFTTLSEATSDATSFTINARGASIGRDMSNEVFVPSDTRMAAVCHSAIEYADGSFYLVDKGFDFGASIRISLAVNRQRWGMDASAQFSAGNSVFRSCGMTPDGGLMVEILEGPLRGERRVITKRGATVGRSSENTISVPDRELSRRHSKIEYDEKENRYYVTDLGSTNGTYMQLVGPYSGRYKLSLNDHILVGRTGFSINRYDYGLSEEMGHRQAMEDSCTIVQHLNILPLNSPHLAPQSFFGVFDGHGGPHASAYLSATLHVHVADSLAVASPELIKIIEEMSIADALDDLKQEESERKSDIHSVKETNDDNHPHTQNNNKKNISVENKELEDKYPMINDHDTDNDIKEDMKLDLNNMDSNNEIKVLHEIYQKIHDHKDNGEKKETHQDEKKMNDDAHTVGNTNEQDHKSENKTHGNTIHDDMDVTHDDVTPPAPSRSLKQAMDDIVKQSLRDAFLRTDADFIATSEHAQNGSTATTALILGHRLYCANVGDSRTLLCRYACYLL